MEKNANDQTALEVKEAEEIAASATTPEPQADSFVTLDYVKELYLNSQEQLKLDKKKIRLIRLCLLCMFLVVVLLAATILLAGPYVKAIVNDINQLTGKIMAIDINAITTQLSSLMTNADTALLSVSDAAGNISKIDMDSLNGAIVELTKTVENFSKMDIGKLNDAIEQLDAAAKALGQIKIPKILGGA